MNAELQSWLPTLILVPLVGLLLYRRFKRTFGKQPVAKTRMIFRMALLAIVAVVVLITSHTPLGLALSGGGLVLGFGLAWIGLAHTRFEVTPAGKFYTPNTWIGLGVTALLLGRLGARFFTVYAAMHQAAGVPPADLQRSPLTAGIFFLMAGYYVVYYAGILGKTRTMVVPPA